MTGRQRRGIAAWCLYDWAQSAFNTVIGTFVFSVYFARGIYGDETAGAAAWGYAIGLGGLAVMVLSPVLGSIADHGGRRKPWIATFLALTAIGSALLWFARPDPAYVGLALGIVVLATIAFELAGVFYNAMLPTVAPPPLIGRVSGWGWGLGYFGGLASLAIVLVALVQPEVPWFGIGKDDAANIRAVGPLVAVWLLAFSLPLFLLAPDRPATGLGASAAISRGLGTLWATIRQLGSHGGLLRFLIASALYRDGLTTLFTFGGLYAAATFGMTQDQLIVFAIGLNVTAGLGAAGFAWLDDGIGAKRTILIALVGLVIFGAALLLVDDRSWFTILGLALGLFVGPAQAASRSYLAKVTPPEMAAEMFGLYAVTGRAVAFLGPIAFAVATDAFASQRAGMATILVFWIAGGLLLMTVPERRVEVAVR